MPQAQTPYTELENLFAQQSWRVTRGVRQVFDYLQSQSSFTKVGDIKTPAKIDLSTKYRILEKLLETKLIHQEGEGFRACSDLNNKQAHHFLICQNCDRAEEIFLDYKASISDQLAREKNFLLTDVRLSFYGRCKNCHS